MEEMSERYKRSLSFPVTLVYTCYTFSPLGIICNPYDGLLLSPIGYLSRYPQERGQFGKLFHNSLSWVYVCD